MTNRSDLWLKSRLLKSRKIKRRMMTGIWSRPLWGQLKRITAILILNLVFNFAICTDMMTKKPIQSDINDEPLISKIMYLAIMIKIVMKDFVDRKTGISWWWVNMEAKEEEEKE